MGILYPLPDSGEYSPPPEERTGSPGVLAATATSYGDAIAVRMVLDPHLVNISYLTNWGSGYDRISIPKRDLPAIITLLENAIAELDRLDELAALSLTEGRPS